MTTIAQLQKILINDTDIIPYDDLARITSYIYLATSSIGLLAGLTLLAGILMRWRDIETRTLLIISLSLGDLINVMASFYWGISDIVIGGWSTGVSGCKWNAIISYGSCAVSTFSLVCLALERYYRICKSVDISMTTGCIWVGLLWLISILGTMYPTWSNTYETTIGLSPSMQTCSIAWWSPKAGGFDVYTIISLTLQIIVIVYCYVQILITYVQAKGRQREQERDGSTVATFTGKWGSLFIDTTQRDYSGISVKEMKLLVMTCVITGCFVVLWGPYNVLINTSLFSHQPVSEGLDAIATLFVNFNSCLNPFLLYFFDTKIKASVNDLGRIIMGLRKKEAYQIDRSVPSTPRSSPVNP